MRVGATSPQGLAREQGFHSASELAAGLNRQYGIRTSPNQVSQLRAKPDSAIGRIVIRVKREQPHPLTIAPGHGPAAAAHA